ncbi:MAG: aldo/keto reductase [Candidatus Hydrogenedentes bacterium]|nr:aldo/keto reductase [Candidatus Hydrogenedentota bacterium]
MKLARRDFLKLTTATAVGMTLAAPALPAETRNGMPYRTLGKTGELVSLLCVGGYHIGVPSEDESIRIMRTAVDEGVNFFDNAWQYHDGLSEERMGKALKDGYRDKVFLMTKHKGRDRATAQQHLEDSLRRLQVDVIDLWQFHEVVFEDEPAKIYENGAIDFALEAKAQGKIRYIGFTGHRFPSIHAEMIDRGFAWDTVQMPLNVFDHHFRSFEQTVLPKATEKNMGIIGMKTCGGTPGNIPGTQAATPAECLRYAMNLPVSSVASGMASLDHLKANIATAKTFKPMEPQEVAALLERSRGPAGDGQHEPYKTLWYKA